MHLHLFPALCAILLATQGCDKVRGIIADKIKQPGTGTSSASFKIQTAELTESNYQDFVNQKGQLIVVNFGAEWCGSCRQLDPVLARVVAEFDDSVKLGKLDVDKARNVAMRSGVMILPDVRFFRDGKQVHQFNGAQPEAGIRETIKKLTKGSQVGESSPKALIQKLIPQLAPEEKDESEPAAEGPAIQPMEKDWLPPGIERR